MAKTKVYTMTQQIKCLTELKEWQALDRHHRDIAASHMRDWFADDNERFLRYSLQSGEILFDFSRNRINQETITLLCQLAQGVELRKKIDALFTGKPINITENRPALHTALRDPHHHPLIIKEENIASLIHNALQKMRDFTQKIHSKTKKGMTGKPIKHIVTVGVGGSYLGTFMCCHALKDFAISDLQFHFISSVDKALIHDVLRSIDPETTLFIISSKTFTTMETMTNAQTLLSWMENCLGQQVIKHHFIAITASTEKALAFGIPEEHIFPLWDWVGGRYSIWSSIGLPLMLMIGKISFDEFLNGAFQMDQHFRHTEFSKNMPVLLALLSIWYMNFFHANAQAIIPYAHRLRHLIAYLQQADMESNGKGTNLYGQKISYETGPVVFGEEGCNGQHSYHQLLHQGQHLIPVDFILVGSAHAGRHDAHQDILVASGLSQAQALMQGKTLSEARDALVHSNLPPHEIDRLARHQVNAGNRPSNILFLERLTPMNLGALLALYEHKIFVQGAIWNINSFDQWGVELGKQLLPSILHHVQTPHSHTPTDPAITGLIQHFKKYKAIYD